jgi:argonaute-like protein implicated in RNA metabolism and viral defense
MRALEESRVPYVLFSSSGEVKSSYTRHGNAMHLLCKAGGLHFRCPVNSVPEFQNHWFVGLDLGFGAQYKGKCVVVSLTDSNGALQCYWRGIKNRDETLPEEILEEALEWVRGQAESIAPGRKYIVIRDGRLPHNESLDAYKRVLPEGKLFLLEYIKKGNPLMLENGGQPMPGSLMIPESSNEAFLFPVRAPQQGMITNTVRFRPRINDLGYSLEQVAGVLLSLCFAPKLSFQPSSLPAPLYWADGIASLSNVNLQFAGWRHLPNTTRDFS